MRLHQAHAILQTATELQAMTELGLGPTMFPVLHDDPSEPHPLNTDYMGGFVEYGDSGKRNARSYSISLAPGPDDQYISVQVKTDHRAHTPEQTLLKESFVVADPNPHDDDTVSSFPDKLGAQIAERIAQVIRDYDLAHHPLSEEPS
ncbi:hypothetical protein ACWFMI_23580 [Nocardiopsis terrae]|uniref:hypothetical protein n=1 Tax=Streptomyces sp. NPDC057554 TaxID=3350538 RepID=UPI0036936A5F